MEARTRIHGAATHCQRQSLAEDLPVHMRFQLLEVATQWGQEMEKVQAEVTPKHPKCPSPPTSHPVSDA